MRIGVYVSPAGAASMEEVLARFVRAEAQGFRTAWSGQVFEHDLLTLLALAGRATRRIELGSWVVPTPTRHPGALAQHFATLDELSGGRMIIGLGTSGHRVIEHFHGVPFKKPLRRTREYVEIINRLISHEPLEYDGVSVLGPDSQPLFISFDLQLFTPAGMEAAIAEGVPPEPEPEDGDDDE